MYVTQKEKQTFKLINKLNFQKANNIFRYVSYLGIQKLVRLVSGISPLEIHQSRAKYRASCLICNMS